MAASNAVQPMQLPKAPSAPPTVVFRDSSVTVTTIRALSSTGCARILNDIGVWKEWRRYLARAT